MSGSFTDNDTFWMRRALTLAARAKGWTSPNPCVGAVLVKSGRIIGESYHRRAGEPHAEVGALRQAGEHTRGATLYVSLEPCAHEGRTPPCTEAIVRAGVRRVVAAMRDPNPRVHGRGLAALRRHGLDVSCGLLAPEALRLNEDFVKVHTRGLPFVTLKTAMTLDGKIADRNGVSQWITGAEARTYAHLLRHRHDALMVGIGTVLADDPQLTARRRGARNPQRIVVDSRARLPPGARLLRAQPPVSVWLATTTRAPRRRLDHLERAGVKILSVEGRDGRVNLPELMKTLAGHSILSVLIEGGGRLAWSALEAGLVDKVAIFVAPKIIGGRDAETGVEGPGRDLADAWRLRDVRHRRLGEDVLIEGYLMG